MAKKKTVKSVQEDTFDYDKPRNPIETYLAKALGESVTLPNTDNERILVYLRKLIEVIESGGGTEVIANPTLAGTEADLTGLQVGETKYAIPKDAIVIDCTSGSLPSGTTYADVDATVDVIPTYIRYTYTNKTSLYRLFRILGYGGLWGTNVYITGDNGFANMQTICLNTDGTIVSYFDAGTNKHLYQHTIESYYNAANGYLLHIYYLSTQSSPYTESAFRNTLVFGEYINVNGSKRNADGVTVGVYNYGKKAGGNQVSFYGYDTSTGSGINTDIGQFQNFTDNVTQII